MWSSPSFRSGPTLPFASCNSALPSWSPSPHLRLSLLHYPAPSVIPYDHSLYIALLSLFLSPSSIVPFPRDSAEQLIWESPSKKDKILLISGKFSECTNYKGLPLLFFSKFFTFSPVVTIRGHCITPQEMLKVRCHQDLRYYFFSSHAILSWNISLQSVIDFSSVNQGRGHSGQNILGTAPSHGELGSASHGVEVQSPWSGVKTSYKLCDQYCGLDFSIWPFGVFKYFVHDC